ncbi:hypothetical protein F5887DRAFT_917108 [Amanita rubescens]|nr:hypothetical protein F5887DRAFT_917108 [Amanita rubescens]
MVKFAFVSVFLIVTAMSALVFAAPPSLEKYSISISGTDYFLLSNGTERAGQPVTLVTGYNPDTTLKGPGRQVVSIRKVTRRGLTVSPVIGKAGLSVTAPEGEHYLVWDTPDIYTLPPWWGFHSRSRLFVSLHAIDHMEIPNDAWHIALEKGDLWLGLKVVTMILFFILDMGLYSRSKSLYNLLQRLLSVFVWQAASESLSF